MKRYNRKKKKHKIIEPDIPLITNNPLDIGDPVFIDPPQTTSYLDGEDLVCPLCGAMGRITIRATELNYYHVDQLEINGSNIYAEMGRLLDGDTQDTQLICENCDREIEEMEVHAATTLRMDGE